LSLALITVPLALYAFSEVQQSIDDFGRTYRRVNILPDDAEDRCRFIEDNLDYVRLVRAGGNTVVLGPDGDEYSGAFELLRLELQRPEDSSSKLLTLSSNGILTGDWGEYRISFRESLWNRDILEAKSFTIGHRGLFPADAALLDTGVPVDNIFRDPAEKKFFVGSGKYIVAILFFDQCSGQACMHYQYDNRKEMDLATCADDCAAHLFVGNFTINPLDCNELELLVRPGGCLNDCSRLGIIDVRVGVTRFTPYANWGCEFDVVRAHGYGSTNTGIMSTSILQSSDPSTWVQWVATEGLCDAAVQLVQPGSYSGGPGCRVGDKGQEYIFWQSKGMEFFMNMPFWRALGGVECRPTLSEKIHNGIIVTSSYLVSTLSIVKTFSLFLRATRYFWALEYKKLGMKGALHAMIDDLYG